MRGKRSREAVETHRRPNAFVDCVPDRRRNCLFLPRPRPGDAAPHAGARPRVEGTATRQKTRFAKGKAQGVYARTGRLVAHPEVATDDATVAQRIRSEAFRNLDVSTGDVDVEVDDGTARLSGSVPDDDVASELVARVARIDGVDSVAAMLRVSGRRT